MKRLLVSLAALPLLVGSVGAAGFPPLKVDVGGSFRLKVYNPSVPGAQLGPWYQYWPLRAHFQVPAPVAYPYWPAQQTLPPRAAAYPYNVVPPGPARQPAAPAAPAVKPVSYQQVPAYWYGN